MSAEISYLPKPTRLERFRSWLDRVVTYGPISGQFIGFEKWPSERNPQQRRADARWNFLKDRKGFLSPNLRQELQELAVVRKRFSQTTE